MPVQATPAVFVGLGGDYDALVIADAPAAFWKLDDASGNPVDSSGNARTLTAGGGLTYGALGLHGDGVGAIKPNGTTGYLTRTHEAWMNTLATACTIEGIVYATAFVGTARIVFEKGRLTSGTMIAVNLRATVNELRVRVRIGGVDTNIELPYTVNSVLYFAARFDGANVKLRVVDLTHGRAETNISSAAVGTLDTNTDALFISNDAVVTTAWLTEKIGRVAVYASALSDAQLALHAAAIWTNLSYDGDVIGMLRCSRGIQGNGPSDCVASTGEMTFALKNGLNSSGGVRGYYSPANSAKRSGWQYGVPIRLALTYSSVEYTAFRGKVREIDPTGGIARDQACRVVAYDVMRDLMEADVREIATGINQTEDALLGAILDALPDESQPFARDLDAGVDSYPYAFDNIQDGSKAGALIKDVALSALGFVGVTQNGVFFYRTRQTRALGSSVFSIDDEMTEIKVPSSLDKTYNRVRVTVHPKTVDAAATTVIYGITGPVFIAGGDTVTLWGEYRDPANTLKLVGATAQVTPIVATTDYLANSAADGSGSNLTGSVSVVTSAFASSVKFVVTNSGSDAYMTRLQIRGKAIYDNGPQTMESYTQKDYGDRPFSLDMPYQDDPLVGQSAAEYLNAQYNDQDQQLESVAFVASDRDSFMTQALTRDIGDLITISETMTGIDLLDAIINAVALEMVGPNLWCRWLLAPANPFAIWQLGLAGASELGETTVLGF